jgi:hypothetical protein
MSPSSPGDLPEFEFWRAVVNSAMVRSASHFSHPWSSNRTLEKMSFLISSLFTFVL